MRDSEQGLSCPGCEAVLERVPLYDTLVAGCRSCGGMWFDNNAGRIVAQARLHPSFLSVVDGFDGAEVVRASGDPSYREAASEKRFCPTCRGLFFDRREVRALHGTLARCVTKFGTSEEAPPQSFRVRNDTAVSADEPSGLATAGSVLDVVLSVVSLFS